MEEMKVGVKYCGGCNPRIKRKEIITEITQNFTDICFQIFDSDQEYDCLISINGCHVGCGISDKLLDQEDVIYIRGKMVDDDRVYNQQELVQEITEKIEKRGR